MKFSRAFFTGLALIVLYWLWVKPPDLIDFGFTEDFCLNIGRQMMADHLVRWGKPVFVTDRFMAPAGVPVPFMSWSIEREWLGAHFWIWKRDFPFFWTYFGTSLVATYVGIGWIMRKMRLSSRTAWGLAALAVLFHVPRHLKTYYHFDHLPQHWAYWGMFLDAWIWQRMWRDRRWSWSLEIWRGMVLMGTLNLVGYFWGPMILEWAIVRIALVAAFAVRWKLSKQQAQSQTQQQGARKAARKDKGTSAPKGAVAAAFQVEGSWKSALFPVAVCIFFAFLDLRWFPPLIAQVKQAGEIFQPVWWFTRVQRFFQPLWLDRLTWPFLRGTILQQRLMDLGNPETAVAIGWLYWIPAVWAASLLRRKRGGPGFATIAPFAALALIAMLYALGFPEFFPGLIQSVVPTLKFFRVASRWGLFLPEIFAVMIALSWPELSAAGKNAWQGRRFRIAAGIFVVLSILEVSWIASPIRAMESLDPSTRNLLLKIKDAPGTTVLDFPFCAAGGNGVCTPEFCSLYPHSTTGGCFRMWHEKKVYGIYEARMTDQYCSEYRAEPYLSWHRAWTEQRCFNESEWAGVCDYFDAHPELSAVLLYPDVWAGAGTPQCQAEFTKHLGAPVDSGLYASIPEQPGGPAGPKLRIQRYAPHCQRK